jgi:N-sulfoglucosamine sulfohydrolase
MVGSRRFFDERKRLESFGNGAGTHANRTVSNLASPGRRMPIEPVHYEDRTMSVLDRRSFLRRAFAGAGLARALGAQTRKRPNILFCISDDQSYPHASAYGTKWIRTPAFDRVAREGALFHHCYVSTPSCGPSRASVLAGQDFYRLREASMNHTVWPPENDVAIYTDLLAQAGYRVGHTGKAWGPGNFRAAGREENPAGAAWNRIALEPPGEGISPVDYAANFEAFLAERPAGEPFCFWAGFVEPHRVFEDGIGVRHGKRLEEIEPPGFFPDVPAVRSDLADYAFEIEYFDVHLGRMLDLLERQGELDNTIVVVTSDNGMAFPRAKATVYDYGARVPLAVRWGDRVRPGRVVEDFVSFADFAPTFLEAAGVPVPRQMTGRSLLPVLAAGPSGAVDPRRNYAVFGIERHFPGSRPEGAGYPMRAIRTRDYLYVRNIEPERNPVGDRPGAAWPEDDAVGGFGDTDGSPTKTFLWENRAEYSTLASAAFDKRPGEELYALAGDPFNQRNLAADPAYAEVKRLLAEMLDEHLRRTADPRAFGRGEEFDRIMRRWPVLGANA